MIAFPIVGPSTFSFRAIFHKYDYANISFLDENRRDILFHLSLRQKDGVAACNLTRRETTGYEVKWRREIQRAVALDRDGVDVSIHVSAQQLTVTLDNAPIFRFRRRFRPRFPDLNDTRFVDHHGGLIPASIDMSVELPEAKVGQGGLLLDHRLELRAPLARAVADKPFRLVSEDTPLLPRVIKFADGDGASVLRCLLPGRVWRPVEKNAPLNVTIKRDDTGETAFSLSLSREELCAHIEAIFATRVPFSHDGLMAAQLIEHVTYADVFADLSPTTRAALRLMAEEAGLVSYLPATAMQPEPAAVPVVSEPTLSNRTQDYVGRLQKALRDDPGARLVDKLKENPPEADIAPFVYVSLTETACAQPDLTEFDALCSYARNNGFDVSGAVRNANTDARSALMAWLFAEGSYYAAQKMMWSVATDPNAWSMTSPAAWMVRRMLDLPGSEDTQKDKIFYAFSSFLEERSTQFWSRLPCIHLTRAMVDLLANHHFLPSFAQRDCEKLAVRIFATTDVFWRELDARGVDVPFDLRALRKAYDTLRTSDAYDPGHFDDIEKAINTLVSAGCVDAPRFARDYLGPSGRQVTLEIGTLAPAQQSLSDELVVRHCARPGGSDSTELAASEVEAAQRYVRRSYHEVSSAPQIALQEWVSVKLAAILSEAEPQIGSDVLRAIRSLSGRGTNWLGLGLGMSLAAGFMKRGADKALTQIVQCMEGITHDLYGDDLAHALDCAAVQRGLYALSAVEGDTSVLGDLRRITEAAELPAVPQEISAEVASLLSRSSPLVDTLVVVFSCQKNLDTTVPQLRNGWLAQLDDLGIPYVILVGGGGPDGETVGPAGKIVGDILYLDVPDDYEGLPAKTLGAVEWVATQTPFPFLFKVDDDCFVNASAFFYSQSHAKFHYYGRYLYKERGLTDRAWHMQKSSSDRGRHEFDKSPEPSVYTDGGTGYTLSRKAMLAALKARSTNAGALLVQTSFMEDKLLGDLLSLCGISPHSEDYYVSIRRKVGKSKLAVPRWVNGFDASSASVSKLVHLDVSDAQKPALEQLTKSQLRPPKLWPSFETVSFGYQSNSVELMSGEPLLRDIADAPFVVVACVRNEMHMLPHFLDHYRTMGATAFLIADNVSDDGSIEYLADQPDVALFSAHSEYSVSQYGVAWQQALLAGLRLGRWTLVADADELLIPDTLPGGSFETLTRQADAEGAEAVRIHMLDMYPRGELDQADFSSGDLFAEAGCVDAVPFIDTAPGMGPYSDQPTWTSALRHRLIPNSRPSLFVSQKIALLKYKPSVRMSAGLHYVSDLRISKTEAIFAHFKYNARFVEKARAEAARRQHFNGAEEYMRYLALVSEGRDVLFDPAISVNWRDCAFVRERLKV